MPNPRIGRKIPAPWPEDKWVKRGKFLEDWERTCAPSELDPVEVARRFGNRRTK